MSFIEFKNVCKMYPGSDRNTVDNFNLNIEEKEFLKIVIVIKIITILINKEYIYSALP